MMQNRTNEHLWEGIKILAKPYKKWNLIYFIIHYAQEKGFHWFSMDWVSEDEILECQKWVREGVSFGGNPKSHWEWGLLEPNFALKPPNQYSKAWQLGNHIQWIIWFPWYRCWFREGGGTTLKGSPGRRSIRRLFSTHPQCSVAT